MAEDESGDGDDAPEVRNPFAGGTESGRADGDPDDPPADSDASFADLAEETRERRRGDPEDGPFERVEVSEVDSEALWESLADADGDPGPGGGSEPVGGADPGEESERGGDADERPEHVVNKREYCQRCRYLSTPPEVACGHEGTDIVELVDADRFRVRGCPMAAGDGPPGFEDP